MDTEKTLIINGEDILKLSSKKLIAFIVKLNDEKDQMQFDKLFAQADLDKANERLLDYDYEMEELREKMEMMEATRLRNELKIRKLEDELVEVENYNQEKIIKIQNEMKLEHKNIMQIEYNEKFNKAQRNFIELSKTLKNDYDVRDLQLQKHLRNVKINCAENLFAVKKNAEAEIKTILKFAEEKTAINIQEVKDGCVANNYYRESATNERFAEINKAYRKQIYDIKRHNGNQNTRNTKLILELSEKLNRVDEENMKVTNEASKYKTIIAVKNKVIKKKEDLLLEFTKDLRMKKVYKNLVDKLGGHTTSFKNQMKRNAITIATLEDKYTQLEQVYKSTMERLKEENARLKLSLSNIKFRNSIQTKHVGKANGI